MNVADELAKLAQLRDQGVLTETEFEQQKAAVLAGEHPATPQAENTAPGKKKMGKGCVIVLAIIVVLIIIGAIAGGGEKEATSSDQQAAAAPEAAPVAVTARELFDAYQANEAKAQQTYGDQRLLVSGTVNGVDLDFSDKPVVKLQTSNEFMSAQASLTEASQPKAKDLNKGEQVSLLCTGVGEVIGTPMLKDCEIQ